MYKLKTGGEHNVDFNTIFVFSVAMIQTLTNDLREMNKQRPEELHGTLKYFLSAWKHGSTQVKMNLLKYNHMGQ